MSSFDKIKILFTDELWKIDTTDDSPLYSRIVRYFRLIRITLKTFAENRMSFQCVSLSYFVTLAIVPLIALLLLLTRGMGFSDILTDLLYQAFPSNPEIISLIKDKALNLLDTVHSGGVGLVSGFIFLWAILWMMFQVERVFNNVWGILRIPRKIYKRFGFYLLVLALSPFLVILFGTGLAFYSNFTKLLGIDFSDIGNFAEIIGWFVLYIISVFTLSVMYKFIPAAKVRYSFAFKSSLLTAVIYCLFQYLYLETQIFVARLNAVYGVIAALPLFLIWLNFSWQIVIYGAELTYSYHSLDKFNLQNGQSE